MLSGGGIKTGFVNIFTMTGDTQSSYQETWGENYLLRCGEKNKSRSPLYLNSS
jgi:hypothetical protein